MASWGLQSRTRLAECHRDQQRVFNEAIRIYNMTVIWGHRGEAAQNAAYQKRASKKKWPHSNHNSLPSTAIDVAPWPQVYGRNDEERKTIHLEFIYMAGIVMTVAHYLEVEMRWGGDWDRDLTIADEHFKDLGHFELVNPIP